MFKNRRTAGLKLAGFLKEYRGEGVVILAVPRGGALVANAIREELKCEWDLIIPKKLGAPFNREIAIGAVTQDGTLLLDEEMVMYLNVSKEYIEREKKAQINEIKRRMKLYMGDRSPVSIKGKRVILVDDGIATGFTIKAAIKSIQKSGASEIIIAVPVAPDDVVEGLLEIVDSVVCLESPYPFYAVGMFYEDFHQTSDKEVMELFNR
ncbi:MAG: phosphoribosyltransferase [Bacillota bacterium]|nr:phosphoribosyltransferase [Bacillota bacterium]MDD3298017.1 phosphoribosyltransferase [Bacillota bacterium]MDD3850048.1 phosphoribosyltransferase [Bacillota bacterium]MDD4706715.1 phosphoribosyltransferase [Bacillota bacterium]